VIPVLCAAGLTVGLSRLPDGADFGWRFGGAAITTQRSVNVEVVRLESGRLEIVDPDHASWDRLSRLAQSEPQRVVSASFEDLTRQTGPFYPSFETRRQQVKLTPWVDSAWSQEDLRQAREAFLSWLSVWHGSGVPLYGDSVTSRVNLGNLLANVALALTLLLALLSLAGQRRYMRVWTMERRLRRGVCGACTYDLARIEPAEGVKTCPECGAAWPESSVQLYAQKPG
jgi:hypothetical protein